MNAVVSFTTFCSSWLVSSTRRIASSRLASRSVMLVRWSVRRSRSKTKLTPEARLRTSNTFLTVTSRSSSEIGLGLGARRLRLHQPLRDERIAHAEVFAARGEIVGALAHRLLEHRECVLAAAFGVALARLVDRHLASAGGEKRQQRENRESVACLTHGVSPEGRTCSVTRPCAWSWASAAFLGSKCSASSEAIGMSFSSALRNSRSCG